MVFMVVFTPAIFSQSTPSGFVDEYFKAIWNGQYSEPIVGITFDETSRLFAWTKEGKVYGVEEHILKPIVEKWEAIKSKLK